MKYLFLLSLFFIAHLVYSQSRVQIPNTNCSLIPPKGFTLAPNFSGLQDTETGATIMITEVPASYNAIVADFTATSAKEQGMTLLSKQTIDLNNSPATLIKVSASTRGTLFLKHLLLFGDKDKTIMVHAIYPESAKHLDPLMQEAILSTTYNFLANAGPIGSNLFSVDVSNTGFKLAKNVSGNLLYSTDGTANSEIPNLIVGNSMAKVTVDDRKQYSLDRLKKLPRGEFNIVQEINEVKIDNLAGYEIVAQGKSKDNKFELVYQVMLFTDGGDYFLILGHTKEQFEKNLVIFRRIAKTFKRK